MDIPSDTRITSGLSAGETGTAESAIAQMTDENGYLVPMAGHQVILNNDTVATVRWDALEPE